MAEKEGGIVKKGHEEGMELAIAILQEFDLPSGLLSLVDVIEVGFVRNTGYMWIAQKKRVKHKFDMINKLISYDPQITGFIDRKRIKKQKGVKAKELMLWPPVNEIIADDNPPEIFTPRASPVSPRLSLLMHSPPGSESCTVLLLGPPDFGDGFQFTLNLAYTIIMPVLNKEQ